MEPFANIQDQSLDQLLKLRGLIIDMDGVLWTGDTPLPGLGEFFEVLKNRGIRFVLATNNPAQSIESFVSKAGRMGLSLTTNQVVSSASATVHYLRSHFPPQARLYAIGDASFKKIIEEAGFVLVDRDASAVIVGMDEDLTYDMLRRASLLIRAGAKFIGTNPDRYAPWHQGLEPGTGAILAAIEASTDCQPLIIGKPERHMFDLALERMSLEPGDVASLGDRLDTDILGGQRSGLKTILVLSGVTNLEALQKSPISPTWVFPGIGEIARAMESSV
jgi:4-nitrophenyl phosphatase